MEVLSGTSYDLSNYQNFELASLWDVRDRPKVQRHFDRMDAYSRAIRNALATRNFIAFERLREEKFNIEQSFDNKLIMFNNDQKSALSFNDNHIRDFEPHQVVAQKNMVLLRGLSIMLSYFAYETSATVSAYSIGTGTGDVFPYQESLEQETDRVVITEGGKSSSGNCLRYSTQFSDGLETNTFSEFALEMFMNSPPALARTVITDQSKKLKHTQGNTFVMGTHYIVFMPTG